VGHKAGLDAVVKRKILRQTEMEPQKSDRPSRSPALHQLNNHYYY